MDLTEKFSALKPIDLSTRRRPDVEELLISWLANEGEQLQRRPFVHQFNECGSRTERLFSSNGAVIYAADQLAKQNGFNDTSLAFIAKLAFERVCIGDSSENPLSRRHIATLGLAYLFDSSDTICRYTGSHTHLYRTFEGDRLRLQKWLSDISGTITERYRDHLVRERNEMAQFALEMYAYLNGGEAPTVRPEGAALEK